MKRRFLGLLIVVALALVSVTPALAQLPQPAIIAFQSSLPSLTMDEAEAGTQTTELSWYTANLTEGYRLRLLTYRRGNWEPVFGEDSVPLEPSGSRVVTIEHPLTFGAPTYLLSIVDRQQRIVDQRTLTIPYDVESVDAPPAIEQFQTDVTSVDAAALASGTALIQVAWQVTGRAPGSNLVFEQVFEDGTFQSIELPRQYLWVPSAGQGPVAPVVPQVPGSPVRLRLRVIDLVSGNAYAEQTITVNVVGFAARPPALSTPVAPTPAPVIPPVQPGSTQIASFVASPSTVNPGAAVTLSWEVRGTGGVSITQSIPNGGDPITVVNAQSPRGSATVYVPDRAAYSVDYTLFTADQSAYQTRTVRVHCPYAFFFGEGDGCPASAPVDIPGAMQEFEGGVMVWRGDTYEIYVFYDGAPGQMGGATGYFLEASYSALPEPGPDGALPPLDRFAPAHGFGKVWANAPGVREGLGWALGPETPVTLTVQQVALTRIPAPEFAIYLRLPDGAVIGTGGNQWRLMQPAP
ncbi:MAG: hypothetical protein LC121_06330 [Anaerolineae bacterium]|nr:hypothetical protein [Anaerolineae bacterium]